MPEPEKVFLKLVGLAQPARPVEPPPCFAGFVIGLYLPEHRRRAMVSAPTVHDHWHGRMGPVNHTSTLVSGVLTPCIAL